MIHDIGQGDNLCVSELDEQDRSFDAVNIKCISLDSVKSIIFTKLESSISQR